MADVRRFSDAEIERLVKFYEQAEREILDRLNRALLRGNKTEYLAQMKKNIEAILEQLRKGNRVWCTEAIPRVYTEGLRNADTMLKDIGVSTSAAFGAIHQQAAQVLAENAYQRFEDVAQVIGRQVNDIYRELALENVRGTVVGYDTWKQTAKRYREQLAERGVTGFKDRSGKMWNMRTYAEMVARTTTMEAHLQGTANRLVEQGHDLVKVSTHLGACELCLPWQGKILSITGKTPGYPALEEAKAAGLFHPNCRHAYGLYIDLDKEIEEIERYNFDSYEKMEVSNRAYKNLMSNAKPTQNLIDATDLSEFEERLFEFTAGDSGYSELSTDIMKGMHVIKTPLTKDEKFVVTFLDLIKKSPVRKQTLYRIEEYGANPDVKYEVGSKFVLGMRSFSASKEWINNVLEGYYDIDYDEPVVYKVKNVKALNIQKYSYFMEQEEYVSAGEFKIINITEKELNGIKYKEIELEQLSLE